MKNAPRSFFGFSRRKVSGWKLLSVLLLVLVLGGVESSQAVLWGNIYELNNAGTVSVTPGSDQWVTFTATQAMTISGGSFVSTSGVASTMVDVSIYAVDGNGKPTGVALGSNTMTTNAAGTYSLTLPNIALTANTVYAVKLSTATPGGSFGWRYNVGPTGGIQPFGVTDASFLRGGGTGSPVAGMNAFYLQTNIGRAVGQPYSSSVAQNAALPTTTLAQRFKFDLAGAGGNNQVDSISLYLGIAATPPSSLVTVKLISSSGVVLDTITRDLSGELVGARNFSFDLATPISLTNGADYYVGIYSNGSASDSVKWYAWASANDPTAISASFQGSVANMVTFSSQSDYTGIPSEVGYRDYAFGLNMVPEPSSVVLLLGGAALLALRRRS